MYYSYFAYKSKLYKYAHLGFSGSVRGDLICFLISYGGLPIDINTLFVLNLLVKLFRFFGFSVFITQMKLQ